LNSAAGKMISGRSWSLWEIMFNFHLVTVVHFLWMLNFYERTPLTSKPRPAPQTGSHPYAGGILGALEPFLDKGLSEIDKQNATDIIETAKGLAKALDLRSTQHRVETFESKLRFDIKGDEYLNEIKVLREAFEYDLKDCHFYHYPRAKAQLLLRGASEWKKIFEAFPDIRREAAAACDCYGLGHDTASVFHSMRVAEHGLRAFAKERRIRLAKNKPIDWGTWQEIITELQKESEHIGKRAAAGTAKDNALSFYSGALADLNAFKDEYRNQVMHVRKDYDEHQALRAMTKVHAFMERISERLSHRNNRIRWGLKFRGTP
jgi:hypothetical protein